MLSRLAVTSRAAARAAPLRSSIHVQSARAAARPPARAIKAQRRRLAADEKPPTKKKKALDEEGPRNRPSHHFETAHTASPCSSKPR